MSRFLSNATNRIDAKGRVSVPAPFRAILQAKGQSELYAQRALDVPALNVAGPDQLERWEQRLASADPFLQETDDLTFLVYGDGAVMKLDADGRIMMTDFIRQHTGIRDEVTFAGHGGFFRMWEPASFEAWRDEARARLLTRRQGMAALPGAVSE
jgi:MraZ protein